MSVVGEVWTKKIGFKLCWLFGIRRTALLIIFQNWLPDSPIANCLLFSSDWLQIPCASGQTAWKVEGQLGPNGTACDRTADWPNRQCYEQSTAVRTSPVIFSQIHMYFRTIRVASYTQLIEKNAIAYDIHTQWSTLYRSAHTRRCFSCS